jgi:hypothetical protein
MVGLLRFVGVDVGIGIAADIAMAVRDFDRYIIAFLVCSIEVVIAHYRILGLIAP